MGYKKFDTGLFFDDGLIYDDYIVENKYKNLFPLQIVFISHKTGQTYYSVSSNDLLVVNANKKTNDIGKISFTTPYNDFLNENVSLDDFIELQRFDKDNNVSIFDTYLMRNKKYYVDENGVQYLLFGGFSLNHLIQRRILDVELDSLEANGYVTIAGNAHFVLEHFADEHFINCSNAKRNFPELTINELETNTVQTGIREKRTNLFSIFQRVATTGKTNFNIVRTSGRELELQLGKLGSDKTRNTNFPFSEFSTINPDLGNVLTPSVEIKRNEEKNYLYLLGEGEGESQFVIEYPNQDLKDSFYNRIEFTQTFRNRNQDYVDYTQALTQAVELLRNNETQFIVSYEIDTETNEPNIELGDYVTFYWEGIQEDLEITEIKLSLSESGTFNKEIEVSPYVK